jgi:hypothetical protein
MYLGNLEAWVCEEKKTVRSLPFQFLWLPNLMSSPPDFLHMAQQ